MNIKWNANEYTQNFDFVHKYGEDVLALIDSNPKGLVIDLGCGNGALTKQLQDKGYRVLGIDASKDMIKIAQANYPDIHFQVLDATTFQLEEKADVIFSNAVIHWIDGDKQDALINNICKQLKPGGIFVCEFGGKGCAETVHMALEKNFSNRGLEYPRTFYFPTIGEYAPILERHRFRLEYATLFDRPTEQKTEQGLEDWIKMFIKKPFEGIGEDLKNKIIQETVEELKNILYKDGKWYIDYVRIRIKARKIL